MRNKKGVLLTVCILFLGSSSWLAANIKFKQMGHNTFVRIRGEVPTSEVMKTLLDRYTGDIKHGFDKACYGGLYLSFIEQLKTSAFKKKELPVGTEIMWMFFRSRGQVQVAEDIEWAGQKPLPVFSFIVKKDYRNYEFVMPTHSGNIALLRVEEFGPDAARYIKVSPTKANIYDPIFVDMNGAQHAKSLEVEVYNPEGVRIETKTLTADSPRWHSRFSTPGEYVFKAKVFNPEAKPLENPGETKIYINFPPVHKLSMTCVPCEGYVGRPIAFDASQSTDPDGEIVKADFEITDETGLRVDTYSDTDKPLTWEKKFKKAGTYSITVVVTDDFGAMSEPSKIDIEVTQKRSFFLIEAGPLFAKDRQRPYVFARVGLLYEIVPDKFSFVIFGGPKIAMEKEPGKSLLMANALFSVHAGAVFFGAGAGFSTNVRKDKRTDAELIANIGFNIFNNWTSSGSIFLEGRGSVGTGHSISKNHKLLIGFRFLF